MPQASESLNALTSGFAVLRAVSLKAMDFGDGFYRQKVQAAVGSEGASGD